MARHGAAARLHRRGCGDGAVLAVRAGTVQLRHSQRDGGRHLRRGHRERCPGIPAPAGADSGRHRGAGHLGRAVYRVGQRPERFRRHRMAGHGAAAGQQGRQCAAGSVLAAHGGGQLQRPVRCDGGRHLRHGNRPGGDGLPDQIRPDRGRRGGTRHMEQTQRGLSGGGQQAGGL